MPSKTQFRAQKCTPLSTGLLLKGKAADCSLQRQLIAAYARQNLALSRLKPFVVTLYTKILLWSEYLLAILGSISRRPRLSFKSREEDEALFSNSGTV